MVHFCYMIISNHESTEDVIVKILAHTTMEMKDLHSSLLKSDRPITLQALYRSVNHLVASGVLVKRGLVYLVNKEWVHGVVDYFNRDTAPQLSAGETVSYSFKSLSALDAYWKHTVLQLHAVLGDYPIFFYNTHVVWLHLSDRKESQTNYLNSFDHDKKYAYFVVGGSSPVDQEFKKFFNREYLRVELRKIDSIKYDSVTTHTDFIITVKFTKKTTALIEQVYSESKTMQELESLLNRRLKNNLSVQLIIERNAKKAEKLRKVLSKNFYIPKEIKDEFKL